MHRGGGTTRTPSARTHPCVIEQRNPPSWEVSFDRLHARPRYSTRRWRCRVDKLFVQRLGPRAACLTRRDALVGDDLHRELKQVALVALDDVLLEQSRVLRVAQEVVKRRGLAVLGGVVAGAVLRALDVAAGQQATRNATPLAVPVRDDPTTG